MISKPKFPPGTVVQYRDEFANDDRSYRVVFKWNQADGTVDVKLSAVMDDEPVEMETISTERLQVIAYCDAEGNIRRL
jgi:predicted metal-dependent RNase